jgi:hypothetical protein
LLSIACQLGKLQRSLTSVLKVDRIPSLTGIKATEISALCGSPSEITRKEGPGPIESKLLSAAIYHLSYTYIRTGEDIVEPGFYLF